MFHHCADAGKRCRDHLAEGVLQLVLPKQTGGEKRAITID